MQNALSFCSGNLADLIRWLHHHNIDTASWERDGAKSVENLWGETQRGESILLENPPRRVVYVVQLWIRRDDLLLVETSQTFDNGASRTLNNLPAEKMCPGESPSQAALRCLREELQIPPDTALIASYPVECWEKDAVSLSYPGLRSVYTLYRVTINLDGLPRHPFTTAELAHSTGDPVVTHHWAWISVDAYQPR